jgi:hypothetical protein
MSESDDRASRDRTADDINRDGDGRHTADDANGAAAANRATDRDRDDRDRTAEEVIAKYREELVAEAELARGDLDEIEDHLRSLYAELRDAGIPRAEAIAQACTRLGEPRKLAREHARVRSPFGARLSRKRAWSAALLIAPFALFQIQFVSHVGFVSPAGAELVIAMLVLAALAARVTWARAIALGALACLVTLVAIQTLVGPVPLRFSAPVLGCYGGALVFLVPWRRGELAPAGIALALLTPAYVGAATAVMSYVTAPSGAMLANPVASISFVSVIAAGAGIVLRARWAAFAAALASLALAGTAHGFWGLTFRWPQASLWFVLLVGSMCVGAVTSAIAAVVSWRTARSALGTLQHVLD